MQIGVIYPQTTMEPDPGAVQHFAQAAEEMGFAYILAYDHVLGANRASRPGVNLPYDLDSLFHEPLILFSFMAARTRRIGFLTGVLVVTQRQAVLAAKQAACLDVLSNGRLRLGVGTGWNAVEFEALGADFATRGPRIEEQVEVMRALWTNRAVTFHGAYHSITDAGIMPMPVQRPIPVWFAGGSDRAKFGKPANMRVLRRIARMGDGWIQQLMPQPRARELVEIFHGYCREYGRDPKAVGVEVRTLLEIHRQNDWPNDIAGWRAVGATHLAVNTIVDGLQGVDAHLKRLELFRQAVPASADSSQVK
jgi:probable F420-dependent oxidoreductase